MTGPIHHLDEELLLDYVSGAASEPVALLAACHLTLCAACRAAAAAAEMVGGAVLEQTSPSPLSPGALSRLLARVDQTAAEQQKMVATDATDGTDQPFTFAGVALPRPLRRYLAVEPTAGAPARQLRFLAPGIRGIDLPAAAPPQVRTRLLRLTAGMEIPRHAHAAPELTLVFSGGFSDDGEHYGPGDIRTRDTAAVHTQRVDAGAPCFALVINQGALLPRTWRGRVVSLLFDH